VLVTLSGAEIALLCDDDIDRSVVDAERAMTLATSFGWLAYGADVRIFLIDALWLNGQIARLDIIAEELAAMGKRFPSPRYTNDAAFARWLSNLQHTEHYNTRVGEGADASWFFDLVSMADAQPGLDACPAARRARSLLGFDAPLDRLDQRVLARARALLHLHRPGYAADVLPLTYRTTLQFAWCYDPSRARVSSRADPARWISLRRRPLISRLLHALATAGGALTKEQLACAVWEVGAYHPLKDDNRLRVNILRLRRTLEELDLPRQSSDPSTAVPWIETTDDGYSLNPARPLWIIDQADD